jgi:hypothetical protein
MQHSGTCLHDGHSLVGRLTGAAHSVLMTLSIACAVLQVVSQGSRLHQGLLANNRLRHGTAGPQLPVCESEERQVPAAYRACCCTSTTPTSCPGSGPGADPTTRCCRGGTSPAQPATP